MSVSSSDVRGIYRKIARLSGAQWYYRCFRTNRLLERNFKLVAAEYISTFMYLYLEICILNLFFVFNIK